MQTIAFAAPILPGKTQSDRDAIASCAHGDRQAEYQASRGRAGIQREAVWIQSTRDGDVAVILIEAPDIQAAMRTLATSQDPFDRWFRENVKDVHGMDLAEGFPPPEQVLDFHG
jgi:hypothetical protein